MAADTDGAIARVRQWLRGTVPGDLARVVGTGDGVATDDVAAVLDALDAAQRSAATERAQREAAEGECARLRAMLDDVADAHERDVLAVWEALGNDHEPPASMANVVHAAETTLGAARVARDAAVAQREALAGAVRRERECEAALAAAINIEPSRSCRAVVLAEASLDGARRTLRTALTALLTEEEVGDGR